MKIIILLYLLFLPIASYTQIISGKITYKIVKEFNTESDYYKYYYSLYGTCFYEELPDELEYILEFSKDESLFYPDFKNVTNGHCIDKISNIIGTMSHNELVIYQNNTLYNYFPHRGTNLLLKNLPINWILTSDTKKIMNINCFKAYYIEYIDLGNDESKTFTHTVWYTPEIPLGYGPSIYFGAPGLILEANHQGGKYSYGATKIEFNTSTDEMKKNITKAVNEAEIITIDKLLQR